jgi:hypothetical protein
MRQRPVYWRHLQRIHAAQEQEEVTLLYVVFGIEFLSSLEDLIQPQS